MIGNSNNNEVGRAVNKGIRYNKEQLNALEVELESSNLKCEYRGKAKKIRCGKANI